MDKISFWFISKNLTDEQAGLLRVGANTGVTDNADRHTSGQGGHADGQARAEVSLLVASQK